MLITRDPTYMTLFTNGACAVRGRIPVRMLQITPQSLIGFDVNVTYAQPHSRTTYANDTKFYARPYLTLATPHIAGVTLRRKKPYVNNVKNARGERRFLNRRIYLICIFYA